MCSPTGAGGGGMVGIGAGGAEEAGSGRREVWREEYLVLKVSMTTLPMALRVVKTPTP